MNILEAIKTGKPFRRKDSNKCWIATPEKDYWKVVSFSFSPEDILADDWEVEEKSTRITRGQFIDALKEALVEHNKDALYKITWDGELSDAIHFTIIPILMKKLGLE